jgi:hypothetical protein
MISSEVDVIINKSDIDIYIYIYNHHHNMHKIFDINNVTSQDLRLDIERKQMCALHSCIENLRNFHAFQIKLVKLIEVSLELMELK